MSDYKQTRDAAGKITSQYDKMLRNLDDDLTCTGCGEYAGSPIADRIEQLVATCEQLEEKLFSATMDGYDMAKHEYRDRIEGLEAKLEKAVESLRVIEDASRLYARDRESDIENVKYAHECTRRLCVTTLAELKGQNDD